MHVVDSTPNWHCNSVSLMLLRCVHTDSCDVSCHLKLRLRRGRLKTAHASNIDCTSRSVKLKLHLFRFVVECCGTIHTTILQRSTTNPQQIEQMEFELNPSTPAVPNCCCLKGSAPYWSNPPFLIFDIRALWRSVLSARAPECQKLKMVG